MATTGHESENITVAGLKASLQKFKDDVVPTSPFGASGTNHSSGLVPDPGATQGTSKYLREDGTWQVPAGGGGSSPYTPTLQSAPDSSTVTYTKDGSTVSFEIGQFCRVADATMDSGYRFYQLHDLQGGGTVAVWQEIGSALERCQIQVTSSESAELTAELRSSAVVTVTDDDDNTVYEGTLPQVRTLKLTPGKSYTVSASAVSGWVAPADQTFVAEYEGTRSIDVEYGTGMYAYVTIDQTQSGDTAMITVSDTAGGAALACPSTSSGTHPNAAIQALRDSSHLYMGSFDGSKMTLRQLKDDDGTKYTDGTTANMDGTDGDHYLRIGAEFYVKRVSGSDSGDQVTYGIAVGGRPDSTWKQLITPNDLLGVHEAYIADSKLYSRSGIVSGGSQTRDTFKTYARNRGTGFQLVTWEWHCVMALLFYAWYGRTNSQAQCGTGSDSYQRTLGTKDSLGMTDTTSNNGNADNTKFWGIENWWGDKYEWIDNVDVQDYVWTIKDIDGNTKRTGMTASSTSGQFVTRMLLSEDLDLIPTGVGGTETTYYCDRYYCNSGSRVVGRSGSDALTYGGVGCVYARSASSNTNTNLGSRLAFSGTIEIE